MRTLALTFLLAGAACRSSAAPEAVLDAAPNVHPSALGGAVAVLDELTRATPPGALVALRALESDALAPGHGGGPEAVRVFLHLTVYSVTLEGAREGLALVERRLMERLATAGPVAPLARARVQALVGELDWDPSGREDLYSYSSALRLIVPADAAARMAPAPRADGAPAATLAGFVTDEARAAGLGPLELASQLPEGAQEVRCAITSNTRDASFLRSEIAAFLAALEEQSPATRVTRLALERSQEAADPHAERSWTFHAELGVAAGR